MSDQKGKDKMTLQELRELQARIDLEEEIEAQLRKADIQASSEAGVDGRNTSQQQLESTDAELIKRLTEKWTREIGIPENSHDQQQAIAEVSTNNSKLAALMEARKNRKVTKITQIADQYIQWQRDEQLLSKDFPRNEPVPKSIENILVDYPSQTGVINVGQEWAGIVEKGVKRKLINQEKAYTNFFWLMAKRGKLGVDLFAITFGVLGILLVPMYFWQRQYNRRRDLREEIRIVSNVKNWESSELDIDDVSVQDTYYNLFTEEFNKVLSKKLQIQQEINRILGWKS